MEGQVEHKHQTSRFTCNGVNHPHQDLTYKYTWYIPFETKLTAYSTPLEVDSDKDQWQSIVTLQYFRTKSIEKWVFSTNPEFYCTTFGLGRVWSRRDRSSRSRWPWPCTRGHSRHLHSSIRWWLWNIQFSYMSFIIVSIFGSIRKVRTWPPSQKSTRKLWIVASNTYRQ